MGKRSTLKEFIEKSSIVHKNKYNYRDFKYDGWNIKSNIICPIHGNFLQTPNNHLKRRGCPKCKFNKLHILFSKTNDSFIKNSNKIHNNKYEYSKFIYTNCKEKGIIICPIHGEFLQTAECHLRGNGCKQCATRITNLKNSSNIKQFINKADKIHQNKYDYIDANYIDSHTSIKINCKQHGMFFQRPDHHLQGIGCPKCNSSKGELKIQKWLLDNKINYEFQKTFDDCRNPKTNRKLEYDFYIPSKNLLIEYDGLQHFKFGVFVGKYKTTKQDLIKIIFRDKIKTDYSKLKNIKLLRIKYDQLSKIDNILSSI